MDICMFTKQVEAMQGRLNELYQGANASIPIQPNLLPVAFKELGIVSEELQVAVEELRQQNEALTDARAEVEAERQRYQELFDFAPEAYVVTDTLGTIKEANRAAARLLNISQQFLVGKPLFLFITEEERQNFHSQLIAIQQAAAEEVQEWALRLSSREGEPFEAVMAVTTIRDRQDKAVGLRICIHNSSKAEYKLMLQFASNSSYAGQLQPKREENENNHNQNGLKHVYLKGEIIPLKPQIIWQVCQGIVKLSTVCENGEEVLVGLLGPSMVFGTDLTSLKTYQATALCQVNLARLCLTDIAASPRLAQVVLDQINQRLRQTEALLAISGQRRVTERFQELLQLLKQEIGQPVEQGTRLLIRFTHQDFADACRTTRVTITRLLGKLQKQGIITLDPKNHIIVRE